MTNKDEWSYVSTHENPADIGRLGSRGVLATQLKVNQLWWNGPTWLSEQPSNWPSYFEISKTLESFLEEKKSATILSVKKDQVSSLKAVIDIERYSSLMRLLKVTAWVRRAVNNFRKRLSE